MSAGADAPAARAIVLYDPRGLVSLFNAHSEIGVPKGPLVAIVDDDESIRVTTKDLLESAGFSAAVFADAASLLKSRRLREVCCLITDMRMPKMTGLELHQHLVAVNRAIPTILMTAYPDERSRTQAIKANVVCYLIKPFAADELLACVRRAALQRHDVGGE
jgi:FixJ family two-component response regulator